MAKIITVLLMASIFVGLLLVAISAWRRRVRDQFSSLSAPEQKLSEQLVDESIRPKTEINAQYVATTFANDPLNRIVAHGLAFRGKAKVLVYESGLVIERRGEQAIAISNNQILGHHQSQAVIDRAVEKGGLFGIDWILSEQKITTYLRFEKPNSRLALLSASEVLSRKAAK